MLQEASKLKMKGRFIVEHRNKAGKLLKKLDITNAIVNEGKNALLDIMFGGATQKTTWYIGLIDNAGFTTLDVTHTHAAHAGWAESTAYTEGARPAWDEAAAAGESMASATPSVFSINTNGTAINGIFVSETSTKGSTAATILWSEASFGAVLNTNSGDTVNVTYQVDA